MYIFEELESGNLDIYMTKMPQKICASDKFTTSCKPHTFTSSSKQHKLTKCQEIKQFHTHFPF